VLTPLTPPLTLAQQLHAAAVELWWEEHPDDPSSERDVEASHSIAFTQPPGAGTTSRRALAWAQRLRTYEDFCLEAQRTPRENTRNRVPLPAEERRLAEWARYQRRFESHLSDFQRVRLDLSPAFEWDPVSSAWARRFAECSTQINELHRLPYLNSADTQEFALARWLNRQLRRQLTGTLSPHQSAALAELIKRAHH
jgi:hypothetical protein